MQLLLRAWVATYRRKNMSTTTRAVRSAVEQDPEPLFETAHPVTIGSLFSGWLPERFIEELIDENGAESSMHEYRLAEVHNNRSDDEGLELLLVGPEGDRIFVGEDITARDSNGLFGFVIQSEDSLPMVRTTEEALNLLKPGEAMAAEMDEKTPLRQGEWFLVPTDDEPSGPVYSGGVSERPFGASPLENHVPTEWAIGVEADGFMSRFVEICPELADHVDTPKEAIHRIHQAWEIASIEDVELETDVPEMAEVRDVAERIYVRGTLRHRENDHYMERVGDGWHLAVTHDVDVFTVETDDLTSDTTPSIRLD